ncbi:MAG TPA: FtsH protease activity modulator HflK [Hyphomicrobiaceae bacterium]|jgi:membrane protease subunit HflK
MPWNNQSSGGGGWKSGGGGGPWGSGGGGGPWGQGPGGGNQPDLEEILKRGQDKVKQVMHGSGVPGPLILLLSAVALAVVGFYAFTFTVRPDELGVVLRFGQFHRQEPPGLHFRLPYPIEEVRLPKVTVANRTEIGFRGPTDNRARSIQSQEVLDESLMLTGDENIVDIGFVVLWNIKDAAAYLFNIENPEKTVKEVAESAMREVVGKSRVQDVLTEKRSQIEQEVLDLVQRTLDSYGAGINITQLQMQRAEAPSQVIDAFRDVAAAAIDQRRIENQAYAYANKVIPEARGEVQRILQEAQAYKERVVAEAQGEADRFLNVLEEYRKAPELMRQRLYLETMERVLSSTDKVIIDSNGGQSVVPYLPLDQLQPRRQQQQQ